jgi:hypothetical protein
MGLSDETGFGSGATSQQHAWLTTLVSFQTSAKRTTTASCSELGQELWSDTLTEYQRSQNRLFTNLDAQNEAHLNAQKQCT